MSIERQLQFKRNDIMNWYRRTNFEKHLSMLKLKIYTLHFLNETKDVGASEGVDGSGM